MFWLLGTNSNILFKNYYYGELIMVRDGWNFHGDIAIPLEGDARHYFGDVNRPMDKIYDADSIELGHFVEVMILLLREKTRFINEYAEIDGFVKDCAPFLGKRGSEIEPNIAISLYNRFCDMF